MELQGFELVQNPCDDSNFSNGQAGISFHLHSLNLSNPECTFFYPTIQPRFFYGENTNFLSTSYNVALETVRQ